jgi:NAD(P)-dependent dehydrogenase (short-subunit alcohol dehydrogenase family)
MAYTGYTCVKVESSGRIVTVIIDNPPLNLTLTPRVQARAASRPTTGLAGRHLFGPTEPTDVAHMAVYLASDQSRMVTGHVLPVDSGVTIH